MPANVAALLASRAAEPASDGPDRTVHIWNIITQTLCLVFMTIFFVLRVYARVNILNGFVGEDCKSSSRKYIIRLLILYRDLSWSLGKTLWYAKNKGNAI